MVSEGNKMQSSVIHFCLLSAVLVHAEKSAKRFNQMLVQPPCMLSSVTERW